jgi:hypothetical protein
MTYERIPLRDNHLLLVLSVLCVVSVLASAAMVYLAATGKDIPPAIGAIAGTSLGALAGLTMGDDRRK